MCRDYDGLSLSPAHRTAYHPYYLHDHHHGKITKQRSDPLSLKYDGNDNDLHFLRPHVDFPRHSGIAYDDSFCSNAEHHSIDTTKYEHMDIVSPEVASDDFLVISDTRVMDFEVESNQGVFGSPKIQSTYPLSRISQEQKLDHQCSAPGITTSGCQMETMNEKNALFKCQNEDTNYKKKRGKLITDVRNCTSTGVDKRKQNPKRNKTVIFSDAIKPGYKDSSNGSSPKSDISEIFSYSPSSISKTKCQGNILHSNLSILAKKNLDASSNDANTKININTSIQSPPRFQRRIQLEPVKWRDINKIQNGGDEADSCDPDDEVISTQARTLATGSPITSKTAMRNARISDHGFDNDNNDHDYFQTKETEMSWKKKREKEKNSFVPTLGKHEREVKGELGAFDGISFKPVNQPEDQTFSKCISTNRTLPRTVATRVKINKDSKKDAQTAKMLVTDL